MGLDTKLQASPGTSLMYLAKGYLLTLRTEGSSPHTVAYYKGTVDVLIILQANKEHIYGHISIPFPIGRLDAHVFSYRLGCPPEIGTGKMLDLD